MLKKTRKREQKPTHLFRSLELVYV